jgi:HSP20 family protein
MQTVKYRNHRPTLFNMFFDDMITRDNLGHVRSEATVPAANVIENDTAFEIKLAAPGLKKEDFNIDLEEDVLKISSSTKNESETNDGQVHRKEFSFTSFSRSFRLPENINIDEIKAEYQAGVLLISLPKQQNAAVEKARQIKVG